MPQGDLVFLIIVAVCVGIVAVMAIRSRPQGAAPDGAVVVEGEPLTDEGSDALVAPREDVTPHVSAGARRRSRRG